MLHRRIVAQLGNVVVGVNLDTSGRSWIASRLKAATTAALLLFPCHATAAAPAKVAEVVQPFIDGHQIAGGVLVVTNRQETIDTEVFGLKNIAAHKPMSADALFWIASMSKPVVATAVMILVDEGKLDLDAPVTRYLPRFKPRLVRVGTDGKTIQVSTPKEIITLRRLLSHTSGIPFSSAPESRILDAAPLSVRVASYAETSLLWEPGAYYQYSNAGMNTAAYIVEVVSGMPYEKFIQQHIFDPLGMEDTTFFPTPAQLGRLATSYFSPQNGQLEEIPLNKLHFPATFALSRKYAVPAGGLFSTAQDMASFARLFLNGGISDGKRIISEAAIHEMITRQNSAEMAKINGSYGLGLTLSSDHSFGHAGAYTTDLHIDPLSGLASIWMVQIVGGDGAKSATSVAKAAIEQFKH